MFIFYTGANFRVPIFSQRGNYNLTNTQLHFLRLARNLAMPSQSELVFEWENPFNVACGKPMIGRCFSISTPANNQQMGEAPDSSFIETFRKADVVHRS